MYNRYIPQPDGSYRRNRIPEPCRPKVIPPPPEPAPPPTPPKPACSRPPHREHQDVTGFLRRLLPKDFDTGDLLIIVLLLLMAGDGTEDQSTALLTLLLYFFL